VTELLDIVKTMDEIELSIFYQELRKIHQFSLLPGYTLSAPFSPKLEIPDKVLPFKVEYKLHTPEQKPGEKQQQRSDPKKKKKVISNVILYYFHLVMLLSQKFLLYT